MLAFAVPPRVAEATADFERVLALEPGQRDAKAGIDWLAAAAEPSDKALVAFLLAVQASMLDPDSPYVRAARAFMLVRQERHDEALAQLDAVLEALPRHARSLAERGALRVRMGKPEEALRDLDAALEIDPRNATALLWRGAAKLRRSEPEAALADFDAVAGRDAEAAGPPVAQFRAEALLTLGRAEEALGDLESAPASALDAQTLAIRGEARLKLGRPGEALADAQHALELHVTHAPPGPCSCSRSSPSPRPAGPAAEGEPHAGRGGRARGRLVPRPAAGAARGPVGQRAAAVAVPLPASGRDVPQRRLSRHHRAGDVVQARCVRLAQPGSIAVADIKKVEKIDGGFKLRAAGKVEAAFTGFTGGGLDLVGPGVSFAAADVLALLRLLVERRRAAA